MKQVRRIVMGDSARDGSFTTVERIEPLEFGPRSRRWYLWGWDETPDLADPPKHYEVRSHFPPPSGVRVYSQEVMLGEKPETDEQRRDKELTTTLYAAQPHGRFPTESRPELNRVELHRTDSIDIGIVVSGEITVEDPSGRRERLGPGDVYVQQGGLHIWSTDTAEPAHMVFVMVGAERSTRPPEDSDGVSSGDG